MVRVCAGMCTLGRAIAGTWALARLTSQACFVAWLPPTTLGLWLLRAFRQQLLTSLSPMHSASGETCERLSYPHTSFTLPRGSVCFSLIHHFISIYVPSLGPSMPLRWQL